MAFDSLREWTRRKLVESRVIGSELVESGTGVIDDFIPSALFCVVYGQKKFFWGDKLSLANLQRKPNIVYDFFDEDLASFVNSGFLFIMTDADALGCYCGEYLHWMATAMIPSKPHKSVIPFQDLAVYEPPRAILNHKIVLTMFKINASQPIPRPIRRVFFSTRDFSKHNGLGSPVAASFYYIDNENELPRISTS